MYVISSNYAYATITLPRLLRSMQESGIPSEDVFVVIGRSPETTFQYARYGTHFFVEWGAYEHTALIAVLDFQIQNDRDAVFLLHDTCEVGLSFHRLVREGLTQLEDAVSVNNAMCGFALYRISYLHERAEEILALRNCDKHAAMVHEGFLCRTGHRIFAYPSRGTTDYQTFGIADVYQTGMPRLKEYYPQVDLWKYKANFGQTNPGDYIERI